MQISRGFKRCQQSEWPQCLGHRVACFAWCSLVADRIYFRQNYFRSTRRVFCL